MTRSRTYLFQEAVDLCRKTKEPDTIVDLGCIKSAKPIAEFSMGWSTLAWLKLTTATVYTVDNNIHSIHNCKRVIGRRSTTEQQRRLHYYHNDASDFLGKFDRSIDLLSLDGPDGLGSILCLYKANHLLKVGSVILLDDCDLPIDKLSRRLTIPTAKWFGFSIAEDTGRQVLMVRNNEDGDW